MKRFGKIGIGQLALLLGAALLPLGPQAMAQAVFGSIFGTVTDSSGAAVPKATVTVTDVAKGTSVTVTSNDSGEFSAEHLIPDTYTVKVEISGFKSFEQKDIPVYADQSQKVVAALTVGSTGETVEVNADQVPQLKTDRADVSTTFNSQEIGNLPIPDHNFTNLQLLLPGAVQLGWAHSADENPQGSKQIQIDGQAFGGVNYTLDGTDNQDAILGIIVVNPNYESMSEAKIATQNYDAEFGKAVASVQTVQTKSGTNAFHGSAFDNRESNANLARDPFTVTKAQGYPGGLKNQFGGSVGGPIWKDHVFFFGDYQGVRQKVGTPSIATIPTLLAMQSCTGATLASNGQPGCDFSEYLAAGRQIYNNNAAAGGVGLGSPFPNNIIPLSLVSPQAKNLFNLLLANKITPNNSTDQGGLTNNYQGSGTGGFNSNQWDVRGDATLSQRVHVFGRFSRFTDVLTGATLLGPAGGPGFGIAGYGGISAGANDSVALGTDIAINSKLVTDVRLGYFRYNVLAHKDDPGNTNIPFLGENVGTATLPVPIDYGAPAIEVADLNVTSSNAGPNNSKDQGEQFGSGLNVNGCNCPLTEREDQFQIVNNWTKTISNHEVKFGVDLRYARNLRVPSDNDRTGVNNFGNGPTSLNGQSGGLGIATFALGDVTSYNRYTTADPNETNAKEFQPRDFGYVQDTWRATPKLTVNAGLRYEFYAPERVNGAGNGSLLNLATGYINVAGEGGIPLNMGVSAPKFPFNPRLGVAYQLNPATVIRAGYGRSFDLGVFGSTFGHVVTQNIPVLANQSISNLGSNTQYAFNLADPSATGNGATNPLITFQSPAISSAGQIAISEPLVPGSTSTVGGSVNVKARPFTERLPTLDAWNFAVQRALGPKLSVTVSYVGNKGTHTLSDGDGNNTNPNEPAITLPAQYSPTGNALHFDPNGGTCYPVSANCSPNGTVQAGNLLIPASGATSNTTLLRRFTNGTSAGVRWTLADGRRGSAITVMTRTRTTTLNPGRSVAKAHVAGLQPSTCQLRLRARHLDAANSFATWDKQAVIGNDSAVRRSAFTAYGSVEAAIWQRVSSLAMM